MTRGHDSLAKKEASAMFWSLINKLPLRMTLTGKRHALMFGLIDQFIPQAGRVEIKIQGGKLELDRSHAPERLLEYYFPNLLRFYRTSPLGKLIAQKDKQLGDIFVDIGANLGMYSIWAKTNGYRVVLFEPESRHFDFLIRNVAVFESVHKVALSNREGSASFYTRTDNSGASSLVKDELSTLQSEDVQLNTFSSVVLSGNNIDPERVKLVKIDVEGAEVETVQGMLPFLSAGHRPDIWCEVRGDTDGRGNGSYLTISNLLAPFGYVALSSKDDQLRARSNVEMAKLDIFDMYFTLGDDTRNRGVGRPGSEPIS